MVTGDPPGETHMRRNLDAVMDGKHLLALGKPPIKCQMPDNDYSMLHHRASSHRPVGLGTLTDILRSISLAINLVHIDQGFLDTWVSPCRGCVSDCHLAMQVARRWTSCTPSALRVAHGPPSRAERCCPHGHLGMQCAANAASLPLAARRASSGPLRYAHIPASPQHAPTTAMQQRALAAFCEASQGCLLLHS